MTPKEALIEKIKKDIICGDDGFYVYWPTSQGYMNEYMLRLVADVLADMNFDWQQQINKYFEEHD